MTSLTRHIYISHASSEFKEHEIPDLLKEIRPFNAKNGITGLLIYTGTAFLQVLEGPHAPLNAAIERISHDRRHIRITTISHDPVTSRLFSDWTMDFVNVDPVDVDAVTEGPSFLTTEPSKYLSPAQVARLITASRKPSWQSEPRAIETAQRAAGGG